MGKTLDVEGLHEDRIQYLKDLVELWKEQDNQVQKAADDQALGNDLDQDIDFATHKSHIIGGISRATAYEDE